MLLVIIFFGFVSLLLLWLVTYKNQHKQVQNDNLLTSQLQRMQEDQMQLSQRFEDRLRYLEELNQRLSHQLKESVIEKLNDHRTKFEERQIEALRMLHDVLQKGIQD